MLSDTYKHMFSGMFEAHLESLSDLCGMYLHHLAVDGASYRLWLGLSQGLNQYLCSSLIDHEAFFRSSAHLFESDAEQSWSLLTTVTANNHVRTRKVEVSKCPFFSRDRCPPTPTSPLKGNYKHSKDVFTFALGGL